MNGMPGDAGVRLRHAPISRNSAQEQVSPKKNAAGGGDRDGEDELSRVKHGYLPYYLPATKRRPLRFSPFANPAACRMTRGFRLFSIRAVLATTITFNNLTVIQNFQDWSELVICIPPNLA